MQCNFDETLKDFIEKFKKLLMLSPTCGMQHCCVVLANQRPHQVVTLHSTILYVNIILSIYRALTSIKHKNITHS